MNDELREKIRQIPAEEFKEPRNQLSGLSYAERLRWLQQTALFVWRYKGVAPVHQPAKKPPTP